MHIVKYAAYASDWPLFLDSFLKLKIRGLLTRAASNREWLMMARVRYAIMWTCSSI
jgi:hypothetical protein